MLDIRLDPLLFQWGPLGLSWHGVWLTIGFFLAYQLVTARAGWQGFSRQTMARLLLWTALASLAGARLFHVVDEWHYYSADPMRMFAVHRGGLSSMGAICAGAATVAFFARRHGLSFWTLADVCVLGVPVSEAIGRIGCTIQGDVHGLPTGEGWGYVYWHPGSAIPADLLGTPTYPAPLFIQLWCLALLLLLLRVGPRLRRPGDLFLAGIGLYALGRLLIGFVQDNHRVALSLTQAQIVALTIVMVSVVIGLWRRQRAPAPPLNPPQ